MVVRGTTDQWIGGQDANRLDDLPQPGRDMRRFMAFEMFEDPVEVLANRSRQFDARQGYLANLRALGRRAGLPAMRASR